MGIVEESFRVFWGDKGYWMIYILCLAFVCFESKKNENKRILLWYSLLILGIILNPLFGKIASKFSTFTTTYIRVFYVLPISYVIAYTATAAISYCRNKKRIAVTIIWIILLGTMGTSYYQLKAYHRAENRYKIPQEEIGVVKQFNIANNTMTGNTKESTAVIFLRYLFVTALPPDSIYTQDL